MNIDNDMLKIMKRIKEKRLELGLSLHELSKKTGISSSTLQRYETGYISNIPLSRLKPLAKALGVTPSYLIGWEDEEEKENNDIENIRIIKNLALFIKNKRQDCNLSIEDLSEKTGISVSTLQSYETEYLKDISLYNLLKLYKALDIQASEILGFFDAIRISSIDNKNKLAEHELDLYNLLKDVSSENLKILTELLKAMINYSKYSKDNSNLKK